jgi:hypothetical protein
MLCYVYLIFQLSVGEARDDELFHEVVAYMEKVRRCEGGKVGRWEGGKMVRRWEGETVRR